MRILGIDPGYGITGFGLIESERGQNRLLQCGAITTPANTDFSWRLEMIYNDIINGVPFAVTEEDVLAIMRTISTVKAQNKYIMKVK